MNTTTTTAQITDHQIKVGAEFRLKTGEIFKIKEIGRYPCGTPNVITTRESFGKVYEYSDTLRECVSFFNDEKAQPVA